MSTSKIAVTEGSGKNVATNSFTEDAVTKEVGRQVLNNSSGTEIGTSATPLEVNLRSSTVGVATAAKQPALGTAGSSSSDVISVQGIASGTALPVSAASLPLPTLAATSTKQSDGSQKTQVVDGSGNVIGTTSNALDVNIKSGNPTTIATTHTDTAPATQNITAADAATTTTPQQNSQNAFTGTPTANSAASFVIAGLATVDIQVTGTWVATLAVEISFDSGTTWFTRGMHLAGTTYTVGSVTSNATGTLSVAGATNVRVRATAYTSGTATVRLAGSVNPGVFYLANSATISDATTPSQKLAVNASGQVSESNFPTTVDTNSGSKSASTVRVVLATDQPALTNKLLVTPDSVALPANQSVNVSQINAVTPLMGAGNTGTGSQRITVATDNAALPTWGHGATAATVPVNAGYDGKIGKTSLPTAVSDGQLVGAMGDKFGRTVMLNNAIRDIMSSQTTTIAASTAETTILTAAASIFNDIAALFVSNTSATATRVDFRDTTGGSVLFSLYVPAGDMRGISFTSPWPQTTVNTNWTAQSSASVTDLRVAVQFIKNK